MTEGDGPINPLSGFCLSFPSALGLVGLLLTYMVILVQFKLT
jgi:hypothetical protein